MTLINALKNNLLHSNVPFNHWTITNPLSEKAIDEIYSINFSEVRLFLMEQEQEIKQGIIYLVS